MRAILHVDMDAFYAAIEQRDAPELIGQPVIIAHSGKRGVVSTASYEARKFGVHSAQPTAVARRLCPQGIYIEPRISHYQIVSEQVFEIFAEQTPQIEGLSLDEAFLDVTHSLSLFGSAMKIGARVKQQVAQRTGLNCSVGIAHNKLLAKMASELSKPNGLLEILPEQVQSTLDPLPVQRLWTIGKTAQAALNAQGIWTIGELRQASLARLQKALGNHALSALLLAQGLDEREVAARTEQSIGAEITFADDLTELSEVRSALMQLIEKVAGKLRTGGWCAETLTLKLRKPPFETQTRQRKLPQASAQTNLLYKVAEALLTDWWKAELRYAKPSMRLLGVSASGLAKASASQTQQHDLFAPANSHATDADTLTDRINLRFDTNAKKLLTRARALAVK
jgi:DNA polymerase IV